jgi:hypothetical protein
MADGGFFGFRFSRFAAIESTWITAMFKADWTERPAVKVWRDLVKTQWWTRADLTTTAYFGWYDITVQYADKTKTFEIRHASSGGKPTLKLE